MLTRAQTLPSVGEIKLVDPLGAKLLSVSYSDQPPWPAPADGSGHSLVLARPTLGEKHAEAWDISRLKGGSPGVAEPPATNVFPTIAINEFMANPTPGNGQWIELYNYSLSTASIAGIYLSDSLSKNKFRIPPGTFLPARTAIRFAVPELGFTLDPLLGTIALTDAANLRVLDAVRYGVQAEGVSTGRFNDGDGDFFPMSTPTPGTSNSAPQIGPVIISEIMAAPVRKPGLELLASADEFVELFNRSAAPVNLTDWEFSGALSYRFPQGTFIRPGQSFAVARDVTNLFFSTGKQITCTNLTGNTVGKLDDTSDEIVLSRPAIVYVPKKNGQIETNHVQIPVDRARYHTSASGPWARRGGASLELIDVRSPGASAMSQWSESEVNRVNQWTSLNLSGFLTESWGAVDRLELHLNGAGEALLDNVRVRSQPNRGTGFTQNTLNGSFEESPEGWFGEGNHRGSGWETNEGQSGNHSLRIVATGSLERGRTPIGSTAC